MTTNFSFSAEKDLAQSDRKRQLNRKLFNIVAPRYNLITRLLSLGRDHRWKKTLVNSLPEKESPLCIDLACGTGDLSILLHQRFKNAQVIGIDITPAMLLLAREIDTSHGIHYLIGDMMHLPVEDNAADIITGGYALRNAPDLVDTLTMIYQKLKPGGVASFLEFSRSKKIVFQALQMKILIFWTSICGFVVHGNRSIYNYIPASLKLFPNLEELEQLSKSIGFKSFCVNKYVMGTITILTFKKPEERVVL